MGGSLALGPCFDRFPENYKLASPSTLLRRLEFHRMIEQVLNTNLEYT